MQRDNGIGWQSALVAVAFLALVASITVAAIVRYSVDDALKVWTPLIALLGVISGAFISYFFTRSAIVQVNLQAQAAEARAGAAEARLDQYQTAIGRLAGQLQPEVWTALLEDPAIARLVDTS